ncbi:MAG: hypothetical protein ABI442_21865 [Gemmatimonadaceae bacterium]
MTLNYQSAWTRASLLATVVATLVAVAPTFASAQSSTSLETAVQHLGYAAKAADVATAKKHMHHALNCLEGKAGTDYDASAGDPCKGVGTDYAAGSANEMKVKKAIGLLNDGEKLDDKAAVMKDAAGADKLLKEIKA